MLIKKKIDRNDAIFEAYKNGKGYSAIGQMFNISRQRAYQIISTHEKTKKDLDNLFKAIKQRDNYRCQWENSCKGQIGLRSKNFRKYLDLVIHHIDLDPTNNDPTNLITLCTQCHRDFHGLEKQKIYVLPKEK